MWQMWKAAVEDVKDVVGFYPTFVTNLDPKSANTIAKTNGIGNVWGRDDAESGICELSLLSSIKLPIPSEELLTSKRVANEHRLGFSTR